MKAIHKIFGEGQIISQDSKTITIDFNGTTKVLLLKFANLVDEFGKDIKEVKIKVKKEKKPLDSKMTAEDVAEMFANFCSAKMESGTLTKKGNIKHIN